MTRRNLMRSLLAAFAASAWAAMHWAARRASETPENPIFTEEYPLPAGAGAHFYDEAIVIAGAEKITVLSPRCPHLGCRINRAEGEELVCPCHGSRFDLRGGLRHGPAARGLRSLSFDLDHVKSIVRVTLPHDQA